MKDFLKMTVASILGVIIAGVVLSVITFILFVGMMGSMMSSVSSSKPEFHPAENTVLVIDLNGSISDRVIENPFQSLTGTSDTQQLSLTDIVSAIKKAKENDQIKGIYIKAGMLSAGTASVDAIRKALIEFKESDKFIVAYGGTYTQSAYYLSSVADKVILNPEGILDLHGLAATPVFYKGLMDKLGVKWEIFKVGTFKSAVEPFMLDKMSDANRQQLTSYMGNIWENVSKNIAESRNMSQEQLNTLVNEGIILKGAPFSLNSGLVDTLLYGTEATDYIKSLVNLEKDKDLLTASVQQMKSIPLKNKKTYNDKIAVLYAEGEITHAPTGAFNTESVISDKEYVKELRKLREDKNIKAVVFRINSPGGSAYMSDQIWKEVTELKKVKPIIVSMGNVAASGGYYIACAADTIVAEPTTITGSIGIFGMFPIIDGLLGKVGITTDAVKTHQFSDFGDISRPMRDDEKALMQAFIEKGYDTFITRCAEGRGKTKAEIDSIGQGRVWTGEQALKLGLVDELGGLGKAIEIAAKRADITEYNVLNYPAQKDFLTQLLEESLGNIKTSLVKSMLNEDELRHFTFFKNIEKQDYIQARIPFDIEIK